MKVKDIMMKNVVVATSSESVSSAFSKIRKHNINQLPVVDNNNYRGMFTLKNAVTKNIDTKTAKCGNLIINTPSLGSEDTLENAAHALLNSGMRALPVIENNAVVGIISESDIISSIERVSRDLLDMEIGKIATECECVSKKDKIGKVRNLMIYKNVSRVPVVEQNKIVGVVRSMDLIKLLEGKETMESRGGKPHAKVAKEKINIEDTLVESIMHSPVVVSSSTQLKSVLASLKEYEEAIVSNGSVKIITPKDILELIVSRPATETHVQIIGLDDENPQFKLKTQQAVDDFMKKMEKMVERIQYLFVHVEKSHKGGARQEYFIRARFGTPMGMFVAKADGWNPATVAQELMNNLEKEVIKEYGKRRTDTKKRRILSKRR
ncbi:MAG: CBS domain-containing protein [Candidatus Aenigmatarchaeota archaeon]